MNLGLKNKIIIVCGASINIGESIVRDFALEGSKVIMLSRNNQKLKKLFDDIGGSKKGHSYYAVDLNESNKIKIIIKKILKKYKKVDVVVHNIGGSLGINDPLSSIDQWMAVWKLNVGIAIEINNLVIPHMKKNNWGRIVHISSITALQGDLDSGSIPYSSAKSFLNSYIKSMGKKFAKNNIVLTGIMPGAILSKGKYWDKIKKNSPSQLKKFLTSHQSIERLGMPSEISSFVVFLASEKSSFACGSIVPVDGGWH